MNFPEGLFSNTWAFGAAALMVAIWFWCLRSGPWRRLLDSGQLNVWLGTIVVLMVMWSMKAGVQPGLNFHLLGATMFTLMFGRQLAIVGLSIVLAAVTFNSAEPGGIGWQPFALNALVMVVFPVLMAYGVLRLVERWLPAHMFVYIFAGCFFGAWLTLAATGLVATLLLAVAGVYPLAMLFAEYYPYYVMMGFAEAWLNGAAITLMIVYYPHWVGTFDDRRYLWKK